MEFNCKGKVARIKLLPKLMILIDSLPGNIPRYAWYLQNRKHDKCGRVLARLIPCAFAVTNDMAIECTSCILTSLEFKGIHHLVELAFLFVGIFHQKTQLVKKLKKVFPIWFSLLGQ